MEPGRSQTIFLLVNDKGIADGLARACRSQGFTPSVCSSVSELGGRLDGSPPAPLILHTAALPPEQTLAEALDYFAWMAGRRVQTLVLATEDDLHIRLAARRAGCIGFHLLPISDTALAESLAPFAGVKQDCQGRVLVVDDVKVEAMISAQVLRKAGFEVQELCNELEIMDSIRGFQPDLILMDLNMPNASGSELTAIIRDHADMLLMPIVFLSGEQDAAAQREAMRLGADEFLSKPVDPQTLVATVHARIRRSSGIRRRFVPLDEIDEATGLMSRRGFVRQLEDRLAGERPGPGDGLLFLCIDDGERLVEDAGVDGEKRLLAHLGTTIRTVLDGNDIAARFAKQSFTVLATRADANALVELAQQLQRRLRDPGIQAGLQKAEISLSIGIAQLADQTDAFAQISRSESACWQARADGPGRVSLARSANTPNATTTPSPRAKPQSIDARAKDKTDARDTRYEPLMALSDRVEPARRYLVLAGPPADGQDSAGAAMRDARPATALKARNSADAHELDYLCMGRALDRVAADCNDDQTAKDETPLRLFVPQSIATVLRREWVLWTRDRLLERQLVAQAPLVVLLAEDLVAHLGVANALFRLLAQLRVGVCLDRVDAQPAHLSLLTDFPITYAIVDPTLVRAIEPPPQLARLVETAHGRNVHLIARGVNDELTLASVRRSGLDLAAGSACVGLDGEAGNISA